MARAYSIAFGELVNSAVGGSHTLYTVPAGKRAIVRQLVGYQSSGGAGQGSWNFDQVWCFKWVVNPQDMISQEDLHIVLDAGQSLAFFIVSGTWYVGAYGYLLDA